MSPRLPSRLHPRPLTRTLALGFTAALLAASGSGCDTEDRPMAAGAGELELVMAPVTSNVCPGGTTVFGIDVSKWQGTINWASVKAAGVKFAIIRVSDGTTYLDEKFVTNWNGAKAQGILRGAYQFFRSNQDPTAQANVLISKLQQYGVGEIPPVIDVETTDGVSASTRASRIGTWLARVQSQLGKKAIIYTGSYFWESNVNSAAYTSHPLWVAHWTTGCPSIPHQWSNWTFHQYSDHGSVGGISGAVDLNRFNGTLAQLQALGGPAPATAPKISINVRTTPPSGQTADFRPEGSSAGVMDLYEGQTYTADVIVKNDGAAAVATNVKVGVWFESPYMTPLSYTIYSDYPHKDGATWAVNDANGNTANPAHNNPPASAKYDLYAFSPGESKLIRFNVRAAQYSIGAVDHPDVRAWVWHVANWYGEQTSWNDTVETNNAGSILRAYKQHDVFARDRWLFEGPDGADTEGWAIQNGVSQLAINTTAHALAIKEGGGDPHVLSGAASIDAAARKGIQLSARTYEGAVETRLYFTTAADGAWNEAKAKSFVTPGDGQFHTLTVDMSTVPGWTGTITRLRLDPTPSGTQWYDVAELRSVASVAGTSGDADGDGVLAAPGGDCDDHDAAVGPGKPETCNGKDDDCNGVTDDGFAAGASCEVGVGLCRAEGTMGCDAAGTGVVCSAVAGAAAPESCNGLDDDCDGDVDEGGVCQSFCFPGAVGPCAMLDEVPAGCEIGYHTCESGIWTDCAIIPGCDAPPVVEEDADVADGDDTDVAEGDSGGGDDATGEGDAPVSGDAVYADARVGTVVSQASVRTRPADTGCAGGAEGGGAWLLALLGLAAALGLRARRRRVA
ncbi:MAG: hypothetical protein KC635_23515 [Myxococcales bacterium]|nr:hypothetical protein [Myxococcales bacterium]MCB9735747.1 hypothetical protein [Deltaproteobacteria bacterium]